MAQMDALAKPGWRFVVSTRGLGNTYSMLQIFLVYEDDKNKSLELLKQIAGLPQNFGIAGYRVSVHDFIAARMNPGDVRQIA